jgi:hypothetical protein
VLVRSEGAGQRRRGRHAAALGGLDAAVAALGPAPSLPSARRIGSLTGRIRVVRAELAAPVFRGSARARELDERIEESGRNSVTAGLHTLPAGPG